MMLQVKHTTRDGETCLVSQMETRHLLNTIRVYARQLQKVYNSAHNPGNKYSDRLYGRHTLSPESAADLINEILTRLTPYIFEAYFRWHEIPTDQELAGIDTEIKAILNTVLEREGRMPLDPNYDLPQLDDPGWEIVGDDDDEWEAF